MSTALKRRTKNNPEFTQKILSEKMRRALSAPQPNYKNNSVPQKNFQRSGHR